MNQYLAMTNGNPAFAMVVLEIVDSGWRNTLVGSSKINESRGMMSIHITDNQSDHLILEHFCC